MPGSPSTRRSRPSPSATDAHQSRSSADSRSRPTSGPSFGTGRAPGPGRRAGRRRAPRHRPPRRLGWHREVERRLLGEDGVLHPDDVVARLDPELGRPGWSAGPGTRAAPRPGGRSDRAPACVATTGARASGARSSASRARRPATRAGPSSARRRYGSLSPPGAAPRGDAPRPGRTARRAPRCRPSHARGAGPRTAAGPLRSGGGVRVSRRPSATSCSNWRRRSRRPQRRARTPGAGHDQVFGGARLAQALAQPRDGGAQRDLRPVAVVVAPERVDEPVDRDDEAAVDQQAGDQGTCLGPADDRRRGHVPGDLERAEHADLQHGRGALRDPCSPPHHSTASRFSRPPCRPRC